VQSSVKRGFDLLVAGAGLIVVGWVIPIAAFIARLDTGESGFFRQTRIGRNGRPIDVIKIRTMRPVDGLSTTVTRSDDPRITRIGSFLRRSKIDELPQLINIIRGDMSFVGPRPDVPGFADRLVGEDRIVLSVRPGITGPATIKYRNEERMLASVDDPQRYNREVIFPDKVRINRNYVRNYTFLADLRYILITLFG
jgi:lipopolysaccharide/colanic/teichoic acid biosynthesis glycosyltransferase